MQNKLVVDDSSQTQPTSPAESVREQVAGNPAEKVAIDENADDSAILDPEEQAYLDQMREDYRNGERSFFPASYICIVKGASYYQQFVIDEIFYIYEDNESNRDYMNELVRRIKERGAWVLNLGIWVDTFFGVCQKLENVEEMKLDEVLDLVQSEILEKYGAVN